MTVSLAHEFGPKVRVNAIQAGPFLTDISKPAGGNAANRGQCAGSARQSEEVVTRALSGKRRVRLCNRRGRGVRWHPDKSANKFVEARNKETEKKMKEAKITLSESRHRAHH